MPNPDDGMTRCGSHGYAKHALRMFRSIGPDSRALHNTTSRVNCMKGRVMVSTCLRIYIKKLAAASIARDCVFLPSRLLFEMEAPCFYSKVTTPNLENSVREACNLFA
jgi:hypothetical protein